MQEQIGNHEHRSEPATPMATDPVFVYFEAGGVIVTLILLGQVLELRARNATAQQARSKSVGSDDLAQVAEACTSGRVETLLIDADRQIAGRLNGATGRVELASLSDPHVDDLLDDLSELVAKKGGTVLVIPAAGMPSRTGLAAIYRY